MHFQLPGSLQSDVALAKQLIVAIEEFFAHTGQVVGGQAEDLRLLFCHDSELSVQQVFSRDPVVLIEVFDDTASENVNDAEFVANINHYVVDVEKRWQNEASPSFEQIVNIRDGVLFVVNVHVLVEYLLPKQGTHPRDERRLLVFEEMNELVPLLVNEKRNFDHETVGQIPQKIMHLVKLVALRILNVFLAPDVQLIRNFEFALNFIQNGYFFRKESIFRINLGEYQIQRPICKRESNHTHDHERRTKPPLRRVSCRDISISNCSDRGDAPIKGNGV